MGPGGAEGRSGWQLVDDSRRGDERAFAELWRRYHPQVQRFVRSKVHDTATAEDLTSEVFIRAWTAIGTVSDQGQDVGAWLIRMARNRVIDHARAQARSRVFIPPVPLTSRDSAAADLLPGPDVTVPEQLAEAGVAAQLAAYLEQVPARERECLRLRYAEELSGAQIGEVLGSSAAGARTLQYRAMTRLRTLIGADGHCCADSFAAAAIDLPRQRSGRDRRAKEVA